MLGEAFYNTFCDDFEVKATDIEVNENWLSYLDVRDIDAIRGIAEDFQPEFIFNLAALTDLEYCERNIEETYLTNKTGVENCALVSEEYHCTYIFISTAGVYDGEKTSYTESDIPAPVSIYGKSKYHAEIAVKEICSKYFIFRAGWMMGGGKKTRNLSRRS